MKQKIILILVAILFGASTVTAHTASAVSLINGQKHYYSVQLRSDKQAIVYGKVIFSADKSEEKSSLTLRLPEGVNVSNLSAQQLLAKAQPGECLVYETYSQWLQRQGDEGTTTRPSSSASSTDAFERTKQCLEYVSEGSYNEDYDFDSNTIASNNYYSPYYYIDREDSFDYQDIKITQNEQLLQFDLPRAIQPEKQGAILLSFTTSDYISGMVGYYTYSFRTLIADSLIDSTAVGIDFDDDLYSSQATQKRAADAVTTSQSSADQGIREGASSMTSVNETQQSVGKGGRYIKTQGKMLPGDTLEVKGTFATNPVLLMGKQIGILLLLLLAGILTYVVYRRYIRAHPKPRTTSAPSAIEGSSAQETGVPTKQWLPALPGNPGDLSLLQMLRLSLISIFVSVGGIWVVTILFMNGDMYDASGIVGILSAELLAVTILTISLFGLIIIPGLNVLRHGIKQAYVWSLVHFTAIFLALFVLSALLSVLATSQGDDYYRY